MAKIGIYYAYWTQEWDVDFHPYIDKVADLGFDVIEINAGTVGRMSSAERQALVQHGKDRNLDFSYCIGLPHEFDLASADAATRERGITYLRQMVEAVGEMGGGNIGGIIYSAWPATMPKGETDKTPYTERSIQSMKQVTQAAEDHNVILNVEVVNRFEQFILNTCDEAIAYVDAVGSRMSKSC